jgi:hypothetical protein
MGKAGLWFHYAARLLVSLREFIFFILFFFYFAFVCDFVSAYVLPCLFIPNFEPDKWYSRKGYLNFMSPYDTPKPYFQISYTQ